MDLPLPSTRWDIDRLTEERTAAIGAFGFTPRQARFLVDILIHSGVFVERQYCRFAGITHGQKTTDFLRRLVEHGTRVRSRPAWRTAAGYFMCTISRSTPPSSRRTTVTESRWRWAG
jgi:hypothetical protein